MDTIETNLDICLARHQAGADLDDCLKDYPEQAAELAGLLVLAAELRALPPIELRAEAVADGRAKMLAAIRQESFPAVAVPSWPRRFVERAGAIFRLPPNFGSQPMLRFALGILIAVLLLSQVAIAASANSLPGDALYPVKRSWEQVRLTFAFTPAQRAELADQFTDARRQEVTALVAQGREATTEIDGTLTGMEGAWSVDGLSIQLQAATVIEGRLVSGMPVRVQIHTLKDSRVVVNWIKPIASGSQTGGVAPTNGDEGSLTAEPAAVTPAPEPAQAIETPKPPAAAEDVQGNPDTVGATPAAGDVEADPKKGASGQKDGDAGTGKPTEEPAADKGAGGVGSGDHGKPTATPVAPGHNKPNPPGKPRSNKSGSFTLLQEWRYVFYSLPTWLGIAQAKSQAPGTSIQAQGSNNGNPSNIGKGTGNAYANGANNGNAYANGANNGNGSGNGNRSGNNK